MENNKYTKEEYNDEPIYVCSHCNDLNIKVLDNTNIDYCVKCGNTDIKEMHINQWLEEKEVLKNKSINSLSLDTIIDGIIKK